MKFAYKYKNKLLWVLFLSIEFMLFRSFVKRDICNMIPLDVDQSLYLSQSYSIYQSIIETNYQEALAKIFSTANTGLPILGVLMSFLFEQSRLSMLIPNFVGFAALQMIGYKITNKVFDNKNIGWGFVGLLLITHTMFQWTGNIVSFRADFLFACLFSIWNILLFESVCTNNNRTYFISSIVAGGMLFIRFFAICFVIPIMLVEIMTFWHFNKNIKMSLYRLALYIGGGFIGGGWFFLANIKNFIGYYLNAMTGDMKEVWQEQLSLIENLIYYPKHFIEFHLGKNLGFILIIISISCLILLKIRQKKLDKQTKRACLILSMAFVVPYIFLMISNKQPMVISMWNGVFIFAVFYVMGGTYREYKNQIIHYSINILSFAIFIAGCINYILNTTGGFYKRYVDDLNMKDVWMLNNQIASWAADNNKSTVDIVLDRWNDILSLESLEMCSAESNGEWLKFKYAIDCMNHNYLTQIFERTDLYIGLHKADVIVVVDEKYNNETIFPTDQLLALYHDDIYDYAVKNLDFLESFNLQGNELQVYVKRPITIYAEWNDWLSIQNKLSFLKKEGDQLLIIEGAYMEGMYPTIIAYAKDDISGKELEMDIEIREGHYKFVIDIAELTEQEHVIELVFDSFFVPNEIADSTDRRQLTVPYPDNCYIERNQEDD